MRLFWLFLNYVVINSKQIIFIQKDQECLNTSCNGSLDNPYDSLISAFPLISFNINSDFSFIFLGNPGDTHYIMLKEFSNNNSSLYLDVSTPSSFFQNNSGITLRFKPFLCSDSELESYPRNLCIKNEALLDFFPITLMFKSEFIFIFAQSIFISNLKISNSESLSNLLISDSELPTCYYLRQPCCDTTSTLNNYCNPWQQQLNYNLSSYQSSLFNINGTGNSIISIKNC